MIFAFVNDADLDAAIYKNSIAGRFFFEHIPPGTTIKAKMDERKARFGGKRMKRGSSSNAIFEAIEKKEKDDSKAAQNKEQP